MSAPSNLLAEYNGTYAKGITPDDIIKMANRIPPLSHSTLKLIRLADDPDSDLNEINDTIALDAGLASTLLRMANSAMFAQQRKIVTIPHALGLVGMRGLKNLVLAKALTGINRHPVAADNLVRDHAIGAALMLRIIAQRTGRRDADDLFLLGMLHRLGQFVFLADSYTKPMFLSVLTRIKENGEDYAGAEFKEFGFSHPLIGALVANRWDFPQKMCQVIMQYADPFEGADDDTQLRTGLVQFASASAHACQIGSPAGYPDQTPLLLRLGQQLHLLGAEPDGELKILLEDLALTFDRESKLWLPS